MMTTKNPDEVTTLATQQPLPLGLIGWAAGAITGGRRGTVEACQAEAGSAARMGDFAAEAWMPEPTPALGGLAPGDLATDSEEGCDEAIRHVVATHRP